MNHPALSHLKFWIWTSLNTRAYYLHSSLNSIKRLYGSVPSPTYKEILGRFNT